MVKFQYLVRDVEFDVDLWEGGGGRRFYLWLERGYFLEDGVRGVELLVFEVLLLFGFELVESLPDGLDFLLQVSHCFVGLLVGGSLRIANVRLAGRALIKSVVVTSLLNHLLMIVCICFISRYSIAD